MTGDFIHKISADNTVNLAFNIGNSPFNKALGKYVIYS